MFSTRAAAATKSSIRALSKVCYRNKFPNSIKVAPLGRRLSTATEASPYYQTPVSNDQNESFSEYRNHDKGGGSDKSSSSVQYSQISINDFSRNAGNWDKSNASFSGNESFRAAERYGQNGGGCSGGVSQSFDQNSRHNLQNFSRANSPAAGDYHQKWDGYKWSKYADGHHQNFQERSENLIGTNGVRHQGRDAGYNGGHSHYGPVGQFSRDLGGSRGGNAGVYHQDGANVPSHQMGGVGQRMPSENNGSMSNYGQFQRVENNYYEPSTGTYQNSVAQQNGNVRSQTANYYNYPGHNVAEYQQNPYGNLIHNKNTNSGPLLSNSNASYPTTSSQASSYSKTDGASPDGVKTQEIRGTVEELEQYVKDGKVKEALEVLELLEKNELRLDPEGDVSTVVKLIEACGEGKDAKEAKIVHKALVKLLSPLTVSVYNKILDMYLKCGSVEDAYSLFNDFSKDDLMSWDTMIRGLAKNDLGEEAIDIFTELKSTGLKPDGRIFIGVFAACGTVGDVIEGMLHFRSMSERYGLTPSMEHYVGVVEMLGHAGYLDNALEFIENMPVDPSVDVWETMMHVCRVQGNVELGDRCAELVEKLDPSRLSEQSKAGLIPLKALDLEKEKKKKKLASQSLLEVRSHVHEYRAGDTSHPENDRIYALLRGLKTQMKEAGYIPELRGVLHDIDPEGKEEALLAHSERLAAAYGFLTTAARQPIRVIKNLRVCVDCHNALKIISKLVGRELIMRDAKRFHHFKDGVCSCKDYW
uniref:DYW domain-containing protein n=1 Tax=Kalanchoe fedtschenkoi TaxID=63787 RepID=A0A7N0TD28_KALFE